MLEYSARDVGDAVTRVWIPRSCASHICGTGRSCRLTQSLAGTDSVERRAGAQVDFILTSCCRVVNKCAFQCLELKRKIMTLYCRTAPEAEI